MNPSTYYHNSDDTKSKKSWGFIAQDVESSFPDFVSETKGLKGLAYHNFAVVAIKAIQEQQAIIEKLTQRIGALENR